MLASSQMRAALLLVVAFTGAAHADIAPVPSPAPAKPAAPVPEAVRLSHYKQFLASIRFSLGMQGIKPYDDDVFCGDEDATRARGFAAACVGRTPFAMDLELGYGAGRKIDVFLAIRIGLESDFGENQTSTDKPHPFNLSPGARFYFSDEGKFKLFTTAQAVLDTTGYKNASGGGLSTDFGFRNMNGLWFDLERAYGVYAFVAEEATFARWLRFEFEAGIGVQGRYR